MEKVKVGDIFGMWKIVGTATPKTYAWKKRIFKKPRYKCICLCGNSKIEIHELRNIKRGRGCGCLRKSELQAGMRKAKGESGLTNRFNQYKNNAKAKRIVFQINREEFRILAIRDCHYCGSAPSSISNIRGKAPDAIAWSEFVCNGVDRVDNAQGYTIENLVPCCKRCNKAKGKSSYQEFLTYLQALAAWDFPERSNRK